MDIQNSQTTQQTQQLTLTPTMRIALEILKMPLLELQTFIQQQLEENPMLELTEHASDQPSSQTDFSEESSASLDPQPLNELDDT